MTDALEEGAFDLVHTRAMLMYAADPDTVLHKLVAALKPGGRLLAEEGDAVCSVADPNSGDRFRDLFARQRSALDQLLEGAGASAFYGRRLYGDMVGQGLLDIENEGRTRMVRGGEPGAVWLRLSVEQLRERTIATGQLTGAEVDELCTLFERPDSRWLEVVVVAVWGRRPPA